MASIDVRRACRTSSRCEMAPISFCRAYRPSGTSHGLAKRFVAGRLLVWCVVHSLTKIAQLEIHSLACAVLIAQWAVLRQTVPRRVGQIVCKRKLCRRIEYLFRDAQRCN